LVCGSRFRLRFVLAGVAVSFAASLAEALLPGAALFALVVGALAVASLADAGKRLWSGSGVLYAGVLVLAVNLLRQSFPFGFESILWLFAVVWCTDVMAYVGGRLIGGPKLWPRVSPSKTWAGFLVGIASGSLAGLAVAPAPGRYGVYILLGLLAGAIAQGGDLFESSLKRRFGAKDSSRLIPGHGGVMDRLDGFLAAAVFAAVLGSARYGVGAPAIGLFTW
jgi:phosphatidate cytidylyltransferase